MRDYVTMYRGLSLTGHMHKMIPVYVISSHIAQSYSNNRLYYEQVLSPNLEVGQFTSSRLYSLVSGYVGPVSKHSLCGL